jgi:hypothetical protein
MVDLTKPAPSIAPTDPLSPALSVERPAEGPASRSRSTGDEASDKILGCLDEGVEVVGDVLSLVKPPVALPHPTAIAAGAELATASGNLVLEGVSALARGVGATLGAASEGTGEVLGVLAEGAGEVLGAVGEGVGAAAEAVGDGLGNVIEALGGLFDGW